jgi:hypothetical protein
MGKACRTNDCRRFIEKVSLMLFSQIDFDFRSQIVSIVRIRAQEHEDFICGMNV